MMNSSSSQTVQGNDADKEKRKTVDHIRVKSYSLGLGNSNTELEPDSIELDCESTELYCDSIELGLSSIGLGASSMEQECNHNTTWP